MQKQSQIQKYRNTAAGEKIDVRIMSPCMLSRRLVSYRRQNVCEVDEGDQISCRIVRTLFARVEQRYVPC